MINVLDFKSSEYELTKNCKIVGCDLAIESNNCWNTLKRFNDGELFKCKNGFSGVKSKGKYYCGFMIKGKLYSKVFNDLKLLDIKSKDFSLFTMKDVFRYIRIIEEKNNYKSSFKSVLHDTTNSLDSISKSTNEIELLLSLENTTWEDIQDQLPQLLNRMANSNKLIYELLRIHGENSTTDFKKSINFYELMNSYNDLFYDLRDGKNIDIVINLIDQFSFRLNSKVELAILNLVHNALKYAIENSSIIITLKSTEKGSYIMISNKSFQNLSKGDLCYIEDYQGQSANGTSNQGNGKGLSFVKSILDNAELKHKITINENEDNDFREYKIIFEFEIFVDSSLHTN